MTTELSIHLSEEALDDVLIGMGSPESEAHLTVCQDCRAKLAEFRSDVHLFNRASLAWSESRVPRPRIAPAKAIFRIPSPLIGMCAVALLLLMVGVPRWNRDNHNSGSQVAPVNSPQANTEAEIAQDNDLLRAVDAAINPDEASSINQYHFMESHHSQLKARPKRGLE